MKTIHILMPLFLIGSNIFSQPCSIGVTVDNITNETSLGSCDGSIEITVSGGTYDSTYIPIKFEDLLGRLLVNKTIQSFGMSINGITQALIDSTTIAEVCLTIDTVPNGQVEDIAVTLFDPCGNSLVLKAQSFPGGNTFNQVCFTPDALVNITKGSSPYTGNWIPEGGALDDPAGPFVGCNPNGYWQLQILNSTMNDGWLDEWSITLNNSGPSIIWSGPTAFTSTSEDITGLCAGTYTVTVSDDFSCTDTQEVDIYTVGINENQAHNVTEVTIFDLFGRKVKHLNRFQTYVVRTKVNGRYSTKKIVLIE